MEAPIPLTLELGPPLHGWDSQQHAALADTVAQDLTALLARLGLPGEPEVQISEAHIRRPFRISAHGRVCRYGADLLRRAWLDAAPADQLTIEADFAPGAGFPADCLLRGKDAGADGAFAAIASEAIRLVVREILAAHPGCLVGARQAAAYAANGDGGAPADAAEALELILPRILDAGFALSSRRVVLETIVAGRRAGRAIDDILEGVLRRLRSDVVELHVHPEFAAQLLGEPLRTEPLSALDPTLPEHVLLPFVDARRAIELRPGIPAPEPVWIASEGVPRGRLALKVGDALGPALAVPDASTLMAAETPDRLRSMGLVAEGTFALFGRIAARVPRSMQEALDANGIRWWSGADVAAALYREQGSLRPDRLFTIAETEQLLAQLATYYPALVGDALNRFLIHDLTQILRELLIGGASIGNLRMILQRLVAFDWTAVDVPGDWEVLADALARTSNGAAGDTHELERAAQFVRLELGEDLLPEYAPPNRPLVLLPVDDVDGGPDADADDAVLDRVWSMVLDPRLRGASIVVVTDVANRRRVRSLVAQELPYVPVLAWPELPGSRKAIELSEEDAAMTALEEVTRARVEEMLAGLVGPVTVDRDGDFVVQTEGARIFVRVVRQDNLVLLRLFSWTNLHVPRSPELYRWAATASPGFGHASIVEHEDGDLLDVLVSHDLLGNFLDTDELGLALIGVNEVAARSASEVKERFGGQLFSEEASRSADQDSAPVG